MQETIRESALPSEQLTYEVIERVQLVEDRAVSLREPFGMPLLHMLSA